jgi:hypothetical protein
VEQGSQGIAGGGQAAAIGAAGANQLRQQQQPLEPSVIAKIASIDIVFMFVSPYKGFPLYGLRRASARGSAGS